MNSIENINNILSALFSVEDTERVTVLESYGKVLKEDIISDLDMPPFRKSAMDGFACRIEDINGDLDIIEEIFAGKEPIKKIGKGECSRIMTGAMVPEDADHVFLLECSEVTPSGKVKCVKIPQRSNICEIGEDFGKGSVLVEKNTIVSASHLALMASAGYQNVSIAKSVKIGILASGTELEVPGKKLSKGKIRNTNSIQIAGQLLSMNVEAISFGIVEDNMSDIIDVVNQVFETCDILLFTGGASFGDYDFAKDAIIELGFEIVAENSGLKPGKPIIIAQKEEKLFIGLAGNPVSGYIQFEYIVKPAIYKRLNGNFCPRYVKIPVTKPYKRKKANLHGIVPIRFNIGGVMEYIESNGSADINALSKCNAFLEIPTGVSELMVGDSAYVRIVY